jgi:Protein of unknown function (DUF1161)
VIDNLPTSSTSVIDTRSPVPICLASSANLARSSLLALAVVFPAAASAQGSACEPLRINIEDKIRRNGVTNFRILTVDAAAASTGRIVGTCQSGTKKLVYVQGLQPSATSASSAAVVSPRARVRTPVEAMITECFDGRVYRDGLCKK